MKNDKWLELTNGVCWSIIFSLAAIIMSIVALADTHPRVLYSADGKTVVLGFDYIGVIVGILALLVTCLVAWNIWQTIDAKNYIKEFEDKTKRYDDDLQKKVDEIKEDLLREFNNNEKITYNIISSLFYQNILSQQPPAFQEKLSLNDYLSKAIDGLSLAKKYNDKTTIVALLEQMRSRVEEAKNQQLTEEEISELLRRLMEIGLKETSDKLVARLQTQLSTFNKPKEDGFDEDHAREEAKNPQ